MWYKCLRDFLIDRGLKNDEVCTCIFNKHTHTDLIIMDVYVDTSTSSVQLTPSPRLFLISHVHLGETTFYLGLQFENLVESYQNVSQ